MFCQEVSLPIAAITEVNEESSDEDVQQPKHSDMFFSCADWETVREAKRQPVTTRKTANFPDSEDDLIDQKFQNKRLHK